MGEAAAKNPGIDPDFKPQTNQELAACLGDPMWRLNNLYHIVKKDDDDDDEETGRVVIFKLNESQKTLAENLWYRNIVPKARQRGITSFACILGLDSCLFTDNLQVGIIAHKEADAKKIFRSKVQFAYNRLPESIKEARPLTRNSAEELEFNNGSSIVVSTSMRSGKTDFLHVSEYGKICAWFPHRAQEIITGSLPSVPSNGIVIIESTAEGRDGDFYHKTMRAKGNAESGKILTKKDYRMHFFSWWDADEYQMDPRGVVITEEDHDYFDEKEAELGIAINMRRRAWYCATRDEDFSGDQQKMYQEYPTTVEECFLRTSEGCYYTKQISKARQEKRIVKRIPVIESAPCWTFWDIGNSDGTAIWVMQKVGQEFRLIDFYEEWGEPYSDAARWLQGLGLTYACHYLPHDADHHRQGKESNKSPREMLTELLPGHKFEVVPRIEDVNWGIQQTRDVFPLLYFDETKCKEGVIHLESYRRKWNVTQQTWSDEPDKSGGHSEAADALRQFGQAYAGGMINVSPSRRKKTPRSNWKTV